MTISTGLAFSVMVLTAALPALAGGGQRPRNGSEMASDAASSAATTGARARSDERRSGQADTGDKPAMASGRNRDRDRPAPGPIVVNPVVTTPTQVGGFTVGKPVVVGSTFVVGNGSPEPRPERRGGRHDSDHRPSSYESATVVVPVYIPVLVETTERVLVQSIGGDTIDTAVTAAPTPRYPDAYFSFTPWYTVSEGLLAGTPVRLPPAETFVQGNVSASVAEMRQARDRVERVAIREYATGTGGVSFDIDPGDTAVFVDGRFVGSADDYAPDREPLLLRFGVYTVELRTEGRVTQRFPVYVTMGEVMPFRGMLPKRDP